MATKAEGTPGQNTSHTVDKATRIALAVTNSENLAAGTTRRSKRTMKKELGVRD